MAFELYPKLQKRSTWEPIIKNDYLLLQKYQEWKWVKNPKGLIFAEPVNSTCIAYKSGMKQAMILLKYNNWEIGKNTCLDLLDEIKVSREKKKTFVFLSMDNYTVVDFYLPIGQVGISFEPQEENKERYDLAVEKFWGWKRKE